MASFSSSSSHFLSPPSPSPPLLRRRISFLRLSTVAGAAGVRKPRGLVVFASGTPPPPPSSSSFDDRGFGRSSHPKKSVLSDLIQEIEPLDISLIQKDVPPTTIDAMKRTISGMLGLLPSNQFQILVEALWEPLSRLLVSSMMTGYTLRNAEYRLCLERNLDIHEDGDENHKQEVYNLGLKEMLLDSVRRVPLMDKSEVPSRADETVENISDENVENLGEISPEVQSYISHLQARLSSAKKELNEVKRKNAALQMQQFVGEEKNELLDYLRSLQPEKVAELSEPTSPEVKEIIHSVIHGLLATLSPKMHSKAPPLTEKNASGAVNVGNEDTAELLENTSLNFHPIISLTRDYLARLLFWCMLLGHYLRGLEYRAQLMELFLLSSNNEDNSLGNEQL